MTQNNPPPQTDDAREWVSQAGPGLLTKAVLFLVGIIVAVFVLAWLIFSGRLVLTPELGQGLPVSAADSVGSLAQPGLIEIEVDGIELGMVQRLDPPRNVEIGGFQFEVSNQYLNDSELWQLVELPANQVGWLENSIVNYVFRLPPTRGYQDMLVNAAAANSIINLTTTTGNQLSFTINEAGEQPITSSNLVMRQNRPAITLLWVGDNPDEASYIVTGEYTPSTEGLQAMDFGIQSFNTEIGLGQSTGNLAVNLQGIDIQANGLQLLVRGVITNRGIEAQVIEAADIQLSANGLESEILSSNPPLPWQVPPNNSQMFFTVTLQRPPESDAMLIIGQQPFALTFQ